MEDIPKTFDVGDDTFLIKEGIIKKSGEYSLVEIKEKLVEHLLKGYTPSKGVEKTAYFVRDDFAARTLWGLSPNRRRRRCESIFDFLQGATKESIETKYSTEKQHSRKQKEPQPYRQKGFSIASVVARRSDIGFQYLTSSRLAIYANSFLRRLRLFGDRPLWEDRGDLAEFVGWTGRKKKDFKDSFLIHVPRFAKYFQDLEPQPKEIHLIMGPLGVDLYKAAVKKGLNFTYLAAYQFYAKDFVQELKDAKYKLRMIGFTSDAFEAHGCNIAGLKVENRLIPPDYAFNNWKGFHQGLEGYLNNLDEVSLIAVSAKRGKMTLLPPQALEKAKRGELSLISQRAKVGWQEAQGSKIYLPRRFSQGQQFSWTKANPLKTPKTL